MGKRRFIAGVVAAAGAAGGVALEAFNRAVEAPGKDLEPQLPVPPLMWRWRYGDVAVYEAGDLSNPPLLLLHGHNAAASAAEMRELFARMSDRFHIYAPDLLGYGLSDRPDVRYTPQLYVELIEDILREVVKRPAAVIASSLTGAHAIEAAVRNPEWVSALVLICPTGVRNLMQGPSPGKVIEKILRLPIIGQALFNAIASRSSISYFLKEQTYHDPSLVTDTLVEGYYRVAHAPGARYAPSAFVAGNLYWDASEAWARLTMRTLLVWGREARITPIADAAAYLATNRAAELEEILLTSLLPHDEQPEQVANLITAWLGRNG